MVLLQKISIKKMVFLTNITTVLAVLLHQVFWIFIKKGIIFDGNGDYFGNALLLCTSLISIIYCHYTRNEMKSNVKLWLADKGVYIVLMTTVLVIFWLATWNDTGSWRAFPAILGLIATSSLFVTVYFCFTRYFNNYRWNLFVLFCLWISLFIVIFFHPDSEMIIYYDIFHLFDGYTDMYWATSFLWLIKIAVIEVLLYVLSFTKEKFIRNE